MSEKMLFKAKKRQPKKVNVEFKSSKNPTLPVYDNKETNDRFGVGYCRLKKDNRLIIEIYVGDCFISMPIESADKMLGDANRKLHNLRIDLAGEPKTEFITFCSHCGHDTLIHRPDLETPIIHNWIYECKRCKLLWHIHVSTIEESSNEQEEK